MPTTTELTEKYISEHPSVKDCLKNGVINYSKLSRKIAKEINTEKKTTNEAILIACRRYATKIKKEVAREEQIMRILKKSELEIKNKIVVVIIDKKIYTENLLDVEKKIRKNADTFYAIEGKNAYTIITSEKHLEYINKFFKRNVLKTSKNMAMIIIKSTEEMETTPGIMAFLYSLFSENGVNIMETMSCWTDTMLVVSEEDTPKVMQFLKF